MTFLVLTLCQSIVGKSQATPTKLDLGNSYGVLFKISDEPLIFFITSTLKSLVILTI